MSKFSSENALIDRLFLKNIPKYVIYDSQFIGMTSDFLDFSRNAIKNFLTYLSENNINPESSYILTILICSKLKFKKKKWEEMMAVYNGLSCGVVVDCRKDENQTISFVFSKDISKYG